VPKSKENHGALRAHIVSPVIHRPSMSKSRVRHYITPVILVVHPSYSWANDHLPFHDSTSLP